MMQDVSISGILFVCFNNIGKLRMVGLQGTSGVYSEAELVVFLDKGLSDLFFSQSIPMFHYSC